ncbi:MAG: chromate efflux transporter [Planctomycetota bacterium]|nr:chromate efflux transporter [Planctomycetota bacterium]
MSRIGELASVSFRLGVLGFGGPAAHIAMLEDEVVKRREWITPERFLDMLGATNLIPGPNSTEMVLHVGYLRAGIPGLLVAGTCFILPAVAIVTFLAWLYVAYGSLPEVKPFIMGIQAVVPVLIAMAVWRLGWTAVKSPLLGLIGLAVVVAVLLEADPVLVLLCGGLAGLLLGRSTRAGAGGGTAGAALLGGGVLATSGGALAAAGAVVKVSLVELGLVFLKIGSVLFGTGYVLVAYLKGELVNDTFGLSNTQLMDAVAAGNLTPGPILSTASFIGYILQPPGWEHVLGLPGAIVASAGIFLPSFFFVLLLAKVLWRLRSSPRMGAFLDGVNVSSVGLMAAVTIMLTRDILLPSEGGFSWKNGVLMVIAAALLRGFKLSPLWLIPSSCAAGWVLFQL